MLILCDLFQYITLVLCGVKKHYVPPRFWLKMNCSVRERKKEKTLKTKIMEETEIQSILLHSETAAALTCPTVTNGLLYIFTLKPRNDEDPQSRSCENGQIK